MTAKHLTSAGEHDLNPQQRAAVEHGDAPLLVLAGAGTGKTRVIAARIAHLVQSGRTEPEQVLAVTFTNRAASEMRVRVSNVLGDRAQEVRIGTFHWAAQRLLRQHASYLHLRPDFKVVGPRESLKVLQQVLQARGSEAALTSLSEIADAMRAFRHGRPVAPGMRYIEDLEVAYRRRLFSANVLDLDGLVLEARRLLERHAHVRTLVRRQLRYVLVDEYQDADDAQASLLSLLVNAKLGNAGRGLTAVGDDDQAIYGWRYANAGHILRFQETYADAAVVRLEQNYRSTGSILRAANALIVHNRQRLRKTLFSATRIGPRPHIYAAGDEFEEGQYVVRLVQQLQSEGVTESQIAVLFRLRAQSRMVEECLTEQGIGYSVQGGEPFYSQPEVRRVIAGLRVVRTPASDEAWAELLLCLPGLSEHRLARVQAAAASASLSLGIALTRKVLPLPPSLLDRASSLASGIYAAREQPGIVAQAEHVRTLIDELASPPSAPGESNADGESTVDELIGALRQFGGQQRGGLGAFLDRLGQQNTAPGECGIQLMTMHVAKGLEFDAVIITGVEEGVIPHRRGLDSVQDIEEERRLLYVGITRARRHLTLTYTRVRTLFGRQSLCRPSRFIDEIPGQLFDVEHLAGGRQRLVSVAPGDHVQHPRWGAGVVKEVAGTGRDTIVCISFSDGVARRLPLSGVPLQRLT